MLRLLRHRAGKDGSMLLLGVHPQLFLNFGRFEICTFGILHVLPAAVTKTHFAVSTKLPRDSGAEESPL